MLLVKSSTTSNKQCFGKALDEWYDKHKDYLNEHTTNDEGKSRYTHKRLGRACLLKQDLAIFHAKMISLFLKYFYIVNSVIKGRHALRSAYHSLKRNLPYLFVYQQNQITHNTTSNTTNKLEGLFGNLKQSLRCHQGLAKKRK